MARNSTTGDNLFTKRIHAGRRTYFIDVKATKAAKDFYVVITESRRINERRIEKHKIFLYKEDFEKFVEALRESVGYAEERLAEQTEEAIAV